MEIGLVANQIICRNGKGIETLIMVLIVSSSFV